MARRAPEMIQDLPRLRLPKTGGGDTDSINRRLVLGFRRRPFNVASLRNVGLVLGELAALAPEARSRKDDTAFDRGRELRVPEVRRHISRQSMRSRAARRPASGPHGRGSRARPSEARPLERAVPTFSKLGSASRAMAEPQRPPCPTSSALERYSNR